MTCENTGSCVFALEEYLALWDWFCDLLIDEVDGRVFRNNHSLFICFIFPELYLWYKTCHPR